MRAAENLGRFTVTHERVQVNIGAAGPVQGAGGGTGISDDGSRLAFTFNRPLVAGDRRNPTAYVATLR